LQLHKAEPNIMGYRCGHLYIYFFHNKRTNDSLAIKVMKRPPQNHLTATADFIC